MQTPVPLGLQALLSPGGNLPGSGWGFIRDKTLRQLIPLPPPARSLTAAGFLPDRQAERVPIQCELGACDRAGPVRPGRPAEASRNRAMSLKIKQSMESILSLSAQKGRPEALPS